MITKQNLSQINITACFQIYKLHLFHPFSDRALWAWKPVICSLLSKKCSHGILWLVALSSLHPISGLMTWKSASVSRCLLDNTLRNTSCTWLPSSPICRLSRLRYELLDDGGEMVPRTPPQLWGTWLNGVLVSPGTPEGSPPNLRLRKLFYM